MTIAAEIIEAKYPRSLLAAALLVGALAVSATEADAIGTLSGHRD